MKTSSLYKKRVHQRRLFSKINSYLEIHEPLSNSPSEFAGMPSGLSERLKLNLKVLKVAEGYLSEIDPDDLFERDHTAVLWVSKLTGYESFTNTQ